MPIDIDTDDYKVDADEVICFSGRQHFLSNLYPVSTISFPFNTLTDFPSTEFMGFNIFLTLMYQRY